MHWTKGWRKMYKHIQHTGFHAEVGTMRWDIDQAIKIFL
jgi:hypothetical protein